VIDCAELAQRSGSIALREKWQRRPVLAEALAVRIFGVLFLELRRIAKQDLR